MMDVHYFNDPELNGISESMLESLADFIRQVWDPTTTRESIIIDRRKEYLENPYAAGGGMPLALLTEGDRVVGHVKSIPCKVWAGGTERLAYWNAGLHLLDECRGKGLGSILPQKTIDTLPLVTGFFVVEQQLRTHTKMGWTIVGKIPEYIKVLNAGQFFRQIDLSGIAQMPEALKRITRHRSSPLRTGASWVYQLVMGGHRVYMAVTSGRPKPIGSLATVPSFDHRVDALWDRSKPFIHSAQVRSSGYMNWQFPAEDGWIKATYMEEGSLQGCAVLSMKTFEQGHSLSGLKVFSIIDVFWDFTCPHVLKGMLTRIEDLARSKGADVVLCSIANSYASRCLHDRGFLNIPGTVYFAFHARDDSPGIASGIDEWFFTRGDADAAGSLGPSQ